MLSSILGKFKRSLVLQRPPLSLSIFPNKFKFAVSSRHPSICQQHYSSNSRNNRLQMKKTELALTTYLIKDDVRYVVPYKYEFKTFAKGRWIGRKIFDILSSEFGGSQQDSSYWHRAISGGLVMVNNKRVTGDYLVNHKDYIIHCTHRHEPPVSGTIEFVGETEELVAVCKPPSLPVHPCGSYRFNSVEYILAKENILPTKSELYVIHRLDKVTSGLVVMAKSKESAIAMQKVMQSKDTKKTYLARVKGRFPSQQILDKIRKASVSTILESVLDIDDSEECSDAKVESSTSSASVNNNNAKRKGDTSNGLKGEKNKKTKVDTSSTVIKDGGGSADINAAENQSSGRDVPKLTSMTEEELKCIDVESLYRSGRVNIAFSDGIEASHFKTSLERSGDQYRTIYLQCPLGILNYREGTHIWRTDGKNCVSAFKCIGYDSVSDTSLIECDLHTGRSHQLRLHLQFLGNPIANDPCYGGVMFYEDSISGNSSSGGDNKRAKARSMLRLVKKLNLETLTRLKHLLKDEIEGDENPEKSEELPKEEDASSDLLLDSGLSDQLRVLEDEYVAEQMKTCSEHSTRPDNSYASYKDINQSAVSNFNPDHVELLDSVRKNCKFCMQRDINIEVERLLHCDGIWLHSFKYRGPQFEFTSSVPSWATGFLGK